MHHLLLAITLVVAVVPIAAPLLLAQAPADRRQTTPASESRGREVYVSVLDRKSAPALGLTASDFTVREQGNVREVLTAGPATEPLTIAVLVDDSQAATDAVPFLRDGLAGFFKALDGKAEVALSTLGERPTSVVEYTKSSAELIKGASRIFAKSGAGAYLLEGISEVSRGLERRKPARPVIVALTVESGPEFSNLYSQNVLGSLTKSGAALHVLAIGTPSSSSTDEMRNRNIVISEGPDKTGGRREQILAESALPDELLELAAELSNQYLVTYARPDSLIPPDKIEVTVTRPGLTARATKRAPSR